MPDIAPAYLATWNADPSDRQRLLDAHWAPEVVYVDPLAEVAGREALDRLIGAVQSQYPDFVFTQASEADAHHRQLRFTWGLGPAGEEPAIIGFDVVVLDEHDRIRDVRGFLDQVPA